MTTELARIDAPLPVLSAPASLIEWADAASAAHRLAAPLVRTDFVPAHFKNSPEAATAAILFGAEAGLSPLQALQGIYVIGGKPAMYARTLLAITLGQGHKVWTEELTDSRAIVCGQRRGSEHVERVVFTMDRARKAGYTKNAKYGTDPQAMLLARAQADVCRRIAPDAMLGMAASVEELEDEAPQPATTMQRDTDKPRTARRATLQRVDTPEPEFDTPADPLDEFHADTTSNPDESIEPLLTTAQNKAIHAHLSSLGITDRDEGLRFLSAAIGREIESSKEIRKSEASALLDEWATPAPAADELWPDTATPAGGAA